MLLLAGGVGGWAATTQIAGALIAQGSVVVDSNVKKVQHPTGGVVGKLKVQDGDRVKAGDILVQLDETVTRANLAIVTKGLDELAARKARLEAERDGGGIRHLPDAAARARRRCPTSPSRSTTSASCSSCAATPAPARRRSCETYRPSSGRDQRPEAQQEAKAREIKLIGKELEGVRELLKKNLVPLTRLTALERDAARLEGERGQCIAAVAQAKGKISETELQIIQIDQDLSSEVAKDMREVDAKYGEFVERKVTAEDQLKRIDIRAPQDGIVLEFERSHGRRRHHGRRCDHADRAGGRQPAGRGQDQSAATSTRCRSARPAMLRFSAFNQRTTPEINGTVTRISADTTTDQRTGQSYYTTRIAMTHGRDRAARRRQAHPRHAGRSLRPDRRAHVMSYLIKPLQDQFMRAFREK